MSKTSPFLQEVDVETNEELETNIQELPKASTETEELKLDERCPEGSLWDKEKGMCVPTETEPIETEKEEDVETLTDVLLEDDDEEFEEQEFIQTSDFAQGLSIMLQNYTHIPKFDLNTEDGKLFYENANKAYQAFIVKYPGLNPEEYIENFVNSQPEVLENNFNQKDEGYYNEIASVYFKDIIDVLESDWYLSRHSEAGDYEHDFNMFADKYKRCKGDLRSCKRKFDQYVKWKQEGVFDDKLLSKKEMQKALKNYIHAEGVKLNAGFSEEQIYLNQLLEGGYKDVNYTAMSEEVRIELPVSEILNEKNKVIKDNGYDKIDSVVTWYDSKVISTSKVRKMIERIHIGEFGDEDNQFVMEGGDGNSIILQTPLNMDGNGGRITMTIYLDDIFREGEDFNKNIAQKRWDEIKKDIVLFFSHGREQLAEEKYKLTYIGGKYHGKDYLAAKEEEVKENKKRKQALVSGMPTDLYSMLYDETGKETYYIEVTTITHTPKIGPGYKRHEYVLYNMNGDKIRVLGSDPTFENEDREVIHDYSLKYAIEEKSKLSENKRHDWLYPTAEESLELNIDDYLSSNNAFINHENNDGTLDMASSGDIAEILTLKYKEFGFTFEGKGYGNIKVNFEPTKEYALNSSKSIELSYTDFTYFGTKIATVASFEKFKLDLVSFVDSNMDYHDMRFDDSITADKLVHEAQQRVYNKFFGEGGVASTMTEEQENEIDKTVETLEKDIFKWLTTSSYGSDRAHFVAADTKNNPYLKEINLAIRTLKGQGVKHPPKELIGALAIELIIRNKENQFIEENIAEWVRTASDQDIIDNFGIKGKGGFIKQFLLGDLAITDTKEEVLDILKLVSTEYNRGYSKQILNKGKEIALLENKFQNGEDRRFFNSFMETLMDDNAESFVKTSAVTREDIDNGNIIQVRTPDGGWKFVPSDVYQRFTLATVAMQMQLSDINEHKSEIDVLLDKVQDATLYNNLLAKSYSWGAYMGTNFIYGLMGGYVKVMATISTGGKAHETWLDFYNDIRKNKGMVSTHATRFDVDQKGLSLFLPWNAIGFLAEFGAEQTESLSQFGFGMLLGTAMGSPQAGLLIGAGMTGMSTFSGNYFERQLEYLEENGDLEGFDIDDAYLYESMAIGGVNFVSAYVSGRFLTQTGKFFKNEFAKLTAGGGTQPGLTAFYQTLKSYAGLELKYGALDASVESLTEIFENLIRGEEINWDVAKEVFIDTGVFNLLLPTTGIGMSALTSMMGNYDGSLDRFREIESRLIKLSKEMENLNKQGLDKRTKKYKDAKALIDEEVDKLVNERMQGMMTLYENMSGLTQQAWAVITRLETLNRQIENQIADIRNDNSLSLQEQQDKIQKLEAQHRQNKKYLKTFVKSGNIKRQFEILLQSDKQTDIDKKNRLIEEAKGKLQDEGNSSPTEEEINDAASVIYNAELINENYQKGYSAYPELQNRTKLAQTKDDAIEIINEFYDSEIDKLNARKPKTDKEAAFIKKRISELKKSKNNAIKGIKNGNHGIHLSTGGVKPKVTNITVVENAAADDRTENKTHEVGHDVWVQMIGANPETYAPLSDLVLTYLQKNHPDIWLLIDTNTERYTSGPRKGRLKEDEVIMAFLEFVGNPDNNINFEGNKGSIFASLFAFFSSEAVESQTGVEFNFDIRGPKGALHFIKTLAEKIRNGTITKEEIENAKKSTFIQALNSNIEQSILDINYEKMSATMAGAVNDAYEGEFDIKSPPPWVWEIMQMYGGMVRKATDKYANIPGIDYTLLQDLRQAVQFSDPRGLLGLINSYNPESAVWEYIDENGNKQELSITYNRDGDVRINKEGFEDLKGFTREQMSDYITANYGDVVNISQIPLSAYINTYLGPRVIDVAKQNPAIQDAIKGITTVDPDVMNMDQVADVDEGGDNFSNSDNDSNVDENTGEVRKMLNIEKGGTLYNKVLNVVATTLPEITTEEMLENPKSMKKYRQALETEFVKELRGDIEEIFNDPEAFEAFLIEHQDAITRLIAIKYKNRFRELTEKGPRMTSDQMRDPDNLATGDAGAGNIIWKIKEMSPEEFVALFTTGPNARTRKNSLLNTLPNELALDAVFTALPSNLESLTGKIAEAIKRDPYVKFSDKNNGKVYDFSNYIKNDKFNLVKWKQDVNKVFRLMSTHEKFWKNYNPEDNTIFGYPEFDPAIVSFVANRAFNMGDDAFSQNFIKFHVEENSNLDNAQVDAFIETTRRGDKNFANDIDEQKRHANEVKAVITEYVPAQLYIVMKGNGWGFHYYGMDAAATKEQKGGARKDGEDLGKDNKSHKGTIPLQVAGWEFDYNATVTVDGVTYTGAFVGSVNGEIVTSLDPVKDYKAKLIRAVHYNTKTSIQNNLNKDIVIDGITVNFDDILIMNPNQQLFKDIEAIQYAPESEMGAYGSQERLDNQKAALLKLLPRIEKANKANTATGVIMNEAWFSAMLDGKASLTSYLRWLQLQTTDINGLKGLSTLTGVVWPTGPKTEVNQGEHMVVMSETSGKLADLAGRALLLDDAGNIIGYKKGYDKDSVRKELFEIMKSNTQILQPKSYSKTMDDGPGGKTSSHGLDREAFLTEEQRSNVYTIRGIPYTEAKFNNAIEEEVEKVTMEINQENQRNRQIQTWKNDIYIKNSSAETSKAMVADFDETLWIGGDNVVVASRYNPDTGKTETISIESENFHKVVKQYEKDGWSFNFDDFVYVKGGERGPYMDRAIRFIKEEGLDGFRVLTARQPEAAVNIAYTLHQELVKEGITDYTVEEILETITGLGVEGVTVTGKMKADWILENVIGLGYNKIEFADDGTENVKEVKEVLDDTNTGESLLVTEKFKDNHEKFSVNKTDSETINEFMEVVSDVPAEKVYSSIEAQIKGGKNKIKGNNVIPYSAEDLKGLLYQFLGEGAEGEYQWAWFQEKLLIPFSQGEVKIRENRVKTLSLYQNLLNNLQFDRKKLKEKVIINGKESLFDYNQAVRVYLWVENGMKIPDLDPEIAKALHAAIQADSQLQHFADQIGAISDTEGGYIKPEKKWITGSIGSDIQKIVNVVQRERYLTEFITNRNAIFSEQNLNKIEVIHGRRFREALENMLNRMVTGRFDAGKVEDKDRVTAAWDKWVNQSVGAIMFVNARSAVLQTLSTWNYIEFEGPNTGINAARAFADQDQYWADFFALFNDPYLVGRRQQNFDVNMTELMQAIEGSDNKAAAALEYLLNLGFTPTRLADSFAIAAGGAGYIRNYTNKIVEMLSSWKETGADISTFLETVTSEPGFDQTFGYRLKQVLKDKDINSLTEDEINDIAYSIAKDLFIEKTETGQQSSRQDMLSMEQVGGLGKLILAFKNTPAQYTRIILRAAQDIKNNRGNTRQNLAKIAYYGGIQAMIFNGLQQALFAKLDAEDEEWEEATDQTISKMVDSILGGMGLRGAVIVTVKNGVLEFQEQKEKGWNADHTYTLLEFANLSPTIGSKLRKLYSSIQTARFNEEVIDYMDYYDPRNPIWSAVGNLIEAFTNIPAGNIVQEMNNLLAISADENEWWQNLTLLLGWNTYDVGVETHAQKLRKRLKEEGDKEEVQLWIDQEVEEDKKKQQQQKNEGKKVEPVYCAGQTTSGDRCHVEVNNAGDLCRHHALKKDLKRCKGITSGGYVCKLDTPNKNGYCEHHQDQASKK